MHASRSDMTNHVNDTRIGLDVVDVVLSYIESESGPDGCQPGGGSIRYPISEGIPAPVRFNHVHTHTLPAYQVQVLAVDALEIVPRYLAVLLRTRFSTKTALRKRDMVLCSMPGAPSRLARRLHTGSNVPYVARRRPGASILTSLRMWGHSHVRFRHLPSLCHRRRPRRVVVVFLIHMTLSVCGRQRDWAAGIIMIQGSRASCRTHWHNQVCRHNYNSELSVCPPSMCHHVAYWRTYCVSGQRPQ
ncbi:hypothetical protein C8Q74DRAFT_273481 [Fomes fomentarius]|nr:hypothetical protein C8Q74DRAFT_273481 [Fomes fomentarius]